MISHNHPPASIQGLGLERSIDIKSQDVLTRRHSCFFPMSDILPLVPPEVEHLQSLLLRQFPHDVKRCRLRFPVPFRVPSSPSSRHTAFTFLHFTNTSPTRAKCSRSPLRIRDLFQSLARSGMTRGWPDGWPPGRPPHLSERRRESYSRRHQC